MTTSCHQSIDEFDILLWSTVHKGDVTSLKTHLSSVLDPNVYLSRVYDEPNGQKCTLLMIACLAGYEDIIYMLLDCFKPDLEVLNIIQIKDKDAKSDIYRDVTVLWAAAAINHFLIVKQLVEQGARINHTTKTNSTPLRCACYSGNVFMARYLVANGAQIHIARENNDTNLILSAYRKHLQMTTYLVDELGCDVNECDNDGCSPLYYAIKCGSLEIAEFLLSRGARNFPSTYNQISPLMLAAEKRRNDLVDAISLYCSTLEWIEAEELIGSAFACAEHGQCDLQQSFEHFYRALELRSTHNLQKTPTKSITEVFNNRQECQTIDQLEELRSNSANMHIEALLVRERLLGPLSAKYRFSLIYRGAILADNKQYHEAIALWFYELQLHQQHSIDINSKTLRQFPSIFSEMVYESLPLPIETVLTIVKVAIKEVKNNTEVVDYNLHTLLFLITIISQPSVDNLFSVPDRRVLYQLLHSVNQNRYITRNNGSSLLHLCLSDRTSSSDDFINYSCKYPCLHTVRTLLKCGADVNAIDTTRNTPLHIFVSNSTTCNETILQLLCDAGAHLDCANALRETPTDIASNSNTKQLLRARIKLSLKCLCARLIQKNDIQFRGIISTSLVNFVEKH